MTDREKLELVETFYAKWVEPSKFAELMELDKEHAECCWGRDLDRVGMILSNGDSQHHSIDIFCEHHPDMPEAVFELFQKLKTAIALRENL